MLCVGWLVGRFLNAPSMLMDMIGIGLELKDVFACSCGLIVWLFGSLLVDELVGCFIVC